MSKGFKKIEFAMIAVMGSVLKKIVYNSSDASREVRQGRKIFLVMR
jgi:hypothetical protein